MKVNAVIIEVQSLTCFTYDKLILTLIKNCGILLRNLPWLASRSAHMTLWASPQVEAPDQMSVSTCCVRWWSSGQGPPLIPWREAHNFVTAPHPCSTFPFFLTVLDYSCLSHVTLKGQCFESLWGAYTMRMMRLTWAQPGPPAEDCWDPLENSGGEADLPAAAGPPPAMDSDSFPCITPPPPPPVGLSSPGGKFRRTETGCTL